MRKQDYLDLVQYLSTGVVQRDDTSSIFFRGFGQLNALSRDPERPDLWPAYLQPLHPVVQEIRDLAKARYNRNSEKVLNGLKQATLSSFFTPTEIVNAIIASLDFTDVKTILDPSAGTGNFLAGLPAQSDMRALEPDFLSFEILKQLYPDCKAQNTTFQEAHLERYDLIISNIPFGAHRVFDEDFHKSNDPVKIAATTRIHNYFFLKGAEHLTESGLMVFITSSAFSDSPSNQRIRARLMEECLLRAAVRLPGEIFSKAGTKPTTDLLILQKRSGQPMTNRDELFIESKQTLTPKGPLNLNRFFEEYPDYMIGEPGTQGQHSNVQYVLSSKLSISDIADKLQELTALQMSIIPEAALVGVEADADHGMDQYIRLTNDQVHHRFENANLYVHKNQIYTLHQDLRGYYLIPVDGLKDPEQVNRLIRMRFTYLDLIEGEQNDAKDIEVIRQALNFEYDNYTFQYGLLGQLSTKKVLEHEVHAHTLYGLEVEVDGRFKKADIFTQRIHNAPDQPVIAETLSDAIVVSINRYNRVHLSYLCQTLNKTQEEIVRQGVREKLLFLDKVGQKWRLVTKDQFLSGDAYQKLQDIKESFPKQFQDLQDVHHSLVTEIVPAPIPFKLIDINLGEPWIDLDLYNQFLTDFFGVDSRVIHFQANDKFQVVTDTSSTVSKIDFAVKGKGTTLSGKELMQHAFSDTSPMITYPVEQAPGKIVRLIDHQAVRNAQDKIEQIKQRFQDWVLDHPEWQNYLEKEYNRLFNHSVPRVYDGSHLKFENLQLFRPYDTQKNAVYRNLQQNGGINDHIVGAGKTLVMAISAYEMKRLGVAKKPLIIAKNANVSSIYKEFKKAYPFSRVLHPSENDFKPKKRRLMFRKMMNNHWDAVIISHDQFKMIPQSLLIQKEILSDELSALQSDLDAVRADEDISPSSYELKGLEKRKNNLNARLEEVKANIKRDDQLMDFETMGFDHLFVDESQEFKNLMYTTRHSRISGLGDPKGSQRAYNLLLACRTIQKNLGNVDKGITFLSGTTISNSLVELYLLFKYLRPNELKRLQIRSFDSWAKVYARKTYEFEFGITNEIKRKERYREFIKVPELARFYTEITDVVNHKNFTQEKPEVENIMTNLPATDDQSKYMDSLVQFAKTKDGSHIGYHNMTKKEQNAYMLIATNLAKKMSLDMRLIDPSYQFAEGSKLDTCSKKLAEIYHNTTSFKGTQLVFCDMSTPSNKWNVYHTLRDLLVIRHNVKPAEIAFIHSVNNGEQKLTLFKRVNDGEIRILIGSTIKMGVGVNVQERVIAMHHLDIPWRPSDMAQRTGRGGRPGNIMAKLHNNNKVWNFVYATEKSLDSYQFNLLHTKQRFIDQIKDNSITARRIDEGSMDSEGGDATMNFAEYVAILSGNQTLLKKVKLDKQIKDLVMQLDGFQAEQRAAERSIRMVNYHTKELEEKIKNQEADFALKLKLEEEPDSIPNMEDRYYYPKPVVLNDVKLYDSRAIGEILLETFRHTNPFILGQYGPFKLLVKKRSLIVYGSNGEEYTSGWGYPTGQPAIAGQYIKRSLNGIKSSLDKLYQERKTYQDSLVSFQRITCKEFGKLDELAKLREESKELEREIEDSVIEESNEQTQTAA